MSVAEITGAPAGWEAYADDEREQRMGFFTDTSVCIGCKACEVACKEWNLIPEDGLVWTGESYDNTSALDANSWRHVAFVEQAKPLRLSSPAVAPAGRSPAPQLPDAADGTMLSGPVPERTVPSGLEPSVATEEIRSSVTAEVDGAIRWLMSSDVCKHCTHAACLDVCPTGSLFRTEFGTVVVQEDICNGCGYCVPACPFGVLDKRELPSRDPERRDLRLPLLGSKEDGRVWKCTLCYDRLKGGHEPACAKACPTDSIQFGPLDELRERADRRLTKLEAEGWNGAQLYGRDPDDGVGGFGAFFLLLDDPEVYGLPPDPVVTTRDLPEIWRHVGIAAGVVAGPVLAAFVGGSR
jgi:formate dehydrogenase iron-sulfur subunit